MTSSVISFAYFTRFLNLNISGTNVDNCKRLTAILFFHGSLSDKLKKASRKNSVIAPLRRTHFMENRKLKRDLLNSIIVSLLKDVKQVIF